MIVLKRIWTTVFLIIIDVQSLGKIIRLRFGIEHQLKNINWSLNLDIAYWYEWKKLVWALIGLIKEQFKTIYKLSQDKPFQVAKPFEFQLLESTDQLLLLNNL